MMHAPTTPTIPYHSLLQEELFKIRPSPLRQFLRGILCRKLSGHSKPTIIPTGLKPHRLMSINRDSFGVPPASDATIHIQIQVENGKSFDTLIDAHVHLSERQYD